MKSYKNIVIGIVVVLLFIVIGIIYRSHSINNSSPNILNGVSSPTSVAQPGTPVAVSETTKVSGSLSEYQNAELGFSVNYPSTWEKEDSNAGVTFIIPVDQTQVSTVATLQANIQVISGKCAFPPVVKIESRDVIQVGGESFKMISISNTVQGREYFNRYYSLQQGNVCYMFSFASISLDPSSKGLTGSNIIQAQNNNKAIVNTADSDFTNMIKSYSVISTPAGQDESTVSPTSK